LFHIHASWNPIDGSGDMRDNGSKQNIRHTARRIWIAVLILLIILILTLALMGALLSGLSGRDRNTIPLTDAGRTGGASAVDAPEMTVEDGQARWTAGTSVDLFRTAYANPQGQITARSADGGKIIAPGTANAYEFSLKNTGGVSLDYTLKLDSAFTLTDREMPMRVRLRSGDRWLLGGESDWARPDELTGVAETGTLDVNQYVTYAFEWQWPYESGADDTLLGDLNDTLLGDAAIRQDVEFRLNIEVLSMVTPGAMHNDRESEAAWGGLSRAGMPWLWGLGALLLLLLLLIFWRTPVVVTGFLPGAGELCLGRQKDTLRPDGRFLFPKVYMGRRGLALGQAECRIRLKRRRKLPGIAFETEDDWLVICVGRRVRAIELYLLPGLTVRRDEWAAIDKDHNVITPAGVREPDENRENTTPGGLHIGRNGDLDIAAHRPPNE